MRKYDDYKKLVEGYNFSLSILKQIKPKLYDKIILSKDLLNKHGSLFAELVRKLKIDYINQYTFLLLFHLHF